MKILLIDDLRDLDYVIDKYLGKSITGTIGYIARTYEQGIEALKTTGPFDLLFLDHDLASFEGDREKTGYDVVCFLEANSELLPRKTILVTSNPVGRQKMQTVLDKLYEDKDDQD